MQAEIKGLEARLAREQERFAEAEACWRQAQQVRCP
eukprot:COSAG05_NODE_398_length_10293_cov_11.919176_7_plen_36_part_00